MKNLGMTSVLMLNRWLLFSLSAAVSAALCAELLPAEDSVTRAWTVFAGTGNATDPVALKPSDPKSVSLRNVYGIETAGKSILFSTVDDHSVWQMDRAGTKIMRIAGYGLEGYDGDGGPSKAAKLNAPHEIRVDGKGNVYLADTRNHCIRRISWLTGEIETLAGDGVAGYRGDNGPGEKARFNQPHSIVLDGDGGLLVADTKNHRVRKIDLETRFVTTIAGNGVPKLPSDDQFATEASLHGPRSLAISKDSLWIVLREGNSVWRVDRESGKVNRVAGTGEKGYSGDGGRPLDATFRGPKGIAVDSKGNLLIVDTENQALRIIDPVANQIRSAAITQKLKRPHGVAVLRSADGGESYLLSDSENHRVLIGQP